MVWSAPMTAVANSVFTAAQFNQFVRDNLNETAPAKATAAGGYFVATGVNAIAERRMSSASDLNGAQTTSTSYTDLDPPGAVGPAVTVTTGAEALVYYHCQCGNSGAGSARASVEVTGASSIAGADNRSVAVFGGAGITIGAGTAVHYTGGLALTPGSNTFTMKYRVSSGTGDFDDRRLIVMPL